MFAWVLSHFVGPSVTMLAMPSVLSFFASAFLHLNLDNLFKLTCSVAAFLYILQSPPIQFLYEKTNGWFSLLLKLVGLAAVGVLAAAVFGPPEFKSSIQAFIREVKLH